jgi:hypothetical protein
VNQNSQHRIALQQFTYLLISFTTFILCGFLNPTNYGKIIRFLKGSVFNAMSTTSLCLNVMHTGHTEPTCHSECSPGQFDHFGGSLAMLTQSFENIQKLVFRRTLGSCMCTKVWFSRAVQKGALDSVI